MIPFELHDPTGRSRRGAHQGRMQAYLSNAAQATIAPWDERGSRQTSTGEKTDAYLRTAKQPTAPLADRMAPPELGPFPATGNAQGTLQGYASRLDYVNTPTALAQTHQRDTLLAPADIGPLPAAGSAEGVLQGYETRLDYVNKASLEAQTRDTMPIMSDADLQTLTAGSAKKMLDTYMTHMGMGKDANAEPELAHKLHVRMPKPGEPLGAVIPPSDTFPNAPRAGVVP